MAQRCSRWNALPRSGGLFAQPLKIISYMESALTIYNAFRARAQAQAAEIPANEFAEKNRAIVEFCGQVDRLRGVI